MSFAVLVCAVIGLCGWCLWRFFKKKRPKDGKKKKDGKTDGVSKKKKRNLFLDCQQQKPINLQGERGLPLYC